MGYEIFSKKRKYIGVPAISITKFGQLHFNKASSVILQKEAVENVLMLWDKERKSVGIRAINKKDSRSYNMRWSKRGDGASFSIASFLRHIEYNATESRSFQVQWDDEQRMFEFTINGEYFTPGGHITPMRRKK
jgi:hypothetical protein